jgi:hypothetical protein
MLHHFIFALHRTICIITAPLYKHQLTNAFNLEQKMQLLKMALNVLMTHLGCPSCFLDHPVAYFCVIRSQWPHLAKTLLWWIHHSLIMALKTFSHNGTSCSLIKLSHDLLAPCNLCLLVVLGKPTIGSFLTGWLSCPNCNSYFELCQFAQVLLWPGLQDGKCPFLLNLTWESNCVTLPDGWHITWDMQPKGKMPCLEFCCYD